MTFNDFFKTGLDIVRSIRRIKGLWREFFFQIPVALHRECKLLAQPVR